MKNYLKIALPFCVASYATVCGTLGGYWHPIFGIVLGSLVLTGAGIVSAMTPPKKRYHWN